jgi:diguanylate cyclase (GGDEF)-like protein/PAS domain S-box-containing protein
MLDIPQAQRVLAAFVESSEDATLSVSLEGRILSWSPGAKQVYGYAEEEILGQPMAMLCPLYELGALDGLLAKAKAGRSIENEIADRLRKDGTRVIVSVRHSVVRNERGEAMLVLENGKDTASRPLDALTDVTLRAVMEQMPFLMWATDRDLRIRSTWGSGAALSQTEQRGLVGRTVYDLLQCHEPTAIPITHHYNALRGVSSRFECWRGDHALEIQLAPLRSPENRIIGCLGIASDITERKKTEENMRFQATHDHLTGLANYGVFMETLERETRRADRSHRPFTVLLLDLDDLKQVNDRLGHLAGNRALKRLANVMKENCRSTDLAARYGGDEFGLISIEADAGMAQHVVERIESCLRKDPEPPTITASMGMALFPSDGRTAQELLEVADRRLYRQKRSKLLRKAFATAP